jgi:alkylhydroperoxidase family enzyme
LILRIGYLCQAGYEWGQHVVIARRAGMSDAEIGACQTGPETLGLSAKDAMLLRAVDELHADAHVSDSTWAGLAAHFDTQQMMDIVFTVGQYNLVSMALNSFGVQLDEGLPGWEIET